MKKDVKTKQEKNTVDYFKEIKESNNTIIQELLPSNQNLIKGVSIDIIKGYEKGEHNA